MGRERESAREREGEGERGKGGRETWKQYQRSLESTVPV